MTHLTPEDAATIDAFQKVARKLMPEGATSFNFAVADFYSVAHICHPQADKGVAYGVYAMYSDGSTLSASAETALSGLQSVIKTPKELAMAEYQAAAEALRAAKTKLDELS